MPMLAADKRCCLPARRAHEKRVPQVNGIEVSELEASAALYTSKQVCVTAGCESGGAWCVAINGGCQPF